jgi:hypothetical protein
MIASQLFPNKASTMKKNDNLKLLEGLQLGVSLSLMARTAMEKISMISSAVIMEEEEH